MTGYQIFTDATADCNDDMLIGLPSVEIIPMEVEIGGPYIYVRPQWGYFRSDVLSNAKGWKFCHHLANQSRNLFSVF